MATYNFRLFVRWDCQGRIEWLLGLENTEDLSGTASNTVSDPGQPQRERHHLRRLYRKEDWTSGMRGQDRSHIGSALLRRECGGIVSGRVFDFSVGTTV